MLLGSVDRGTAIEHSLLMSWTCLNILIEAEILDAKKHPLLNRHTLFVILMQLIKNNKNNAQDKKTIVLFQTYGSTAISCKITHILDHHFNNGSKNVLLVA